MNSGWVVQAHTAHRASVASCFPYCLMLCKPCTRLCGRAQCDCKRMLMISLTVNAMLKSRHLLAQEHRLQAACHMQEQARNTATARSVEAYQ